MFDPAEYVEKIVEELRKGYGGAGRVLAAVSGGVDSVTSAVLVRRALGNVVRAVYVNTGFMRLGEGELVRGGLKGLLKVEEVDRSSDFYGAVLGLEDAEQKRIAFRGIFYRVLAELVRECGCDYLVQGTIKADVVETVGGIKTQHNVLSEELQRRFGVRVIEPLKDLYKHEVREVARYLGIPESIVNRQPFPGPGLLIRAVGRFTLKKLEVTQKATEVVEEALAGVRASQYFAAVWEYGLGSASRVCLSSGKCVEFYKFKTLATGVRERRRVYLPVALLREDPGLGGGELLELVEKTGVSRFVLLLDERGHGDYFVSVRAVKTVDFMTADVVRPPDSVLLKTVLQLLDIGGIRAVGFDITPKPPATIEYE